MQLEWTQEVTTTFRWPIPLNRTMAVPAECIGKTITTPEILERSHPFVEKNPAQRSVGISLDRIMSFHPGLNERKMSAEAWRVRHG